ncbi:MAG TPA: 4Fe-4S cluster-binding domain-containing protein [Phycisphaerae bacterium]|nr:4Fe-4S cluster-binding domain-containing protein [Phycisphaerae bacterium]
MSRVTLPTAAGGESRRVRYLRSIDEVANIPESERERLRKVAGEYVFRANDYYLELIDWDDPDDPIRQLIIPRAEELNDWGRLDASNEARYTVSQGVQHKYPDTVLLLCNEVCGAYCRYCFRKRLFMDDNDEVTKDVSAGIRYIAAHPEVNNVLLTGGDPLVMSTRRLREIIEALARIEHVRIIRIGSKMPAFDPFRILHDAELRDLLGKHSTPRRRIYLMAHFDHPRELTEPAVDGLDAYIRLGVICVNQCPLIRGVNDDPEVLGELYRRLSWIGCPPYYLFQGRPTAGNEPYEVPIVRGWEIFREALRHGSGLARRARYCMSHETGKVEISGVDEQYIYLRYHRARDPKLRGRLMLYHRDDNASWLDDLRPVEETAALPFGAESLLDVTSGPE